MEGPGEIDMSRADLSAIENQLQLAINEHPHLQQKRFRFNAKEGRITLHGTVKSWYEKQMAQEALRHIDGVTKIDNELTVEIA